MRLTPPTNLLAFAISALLLLLGAGQVSAQCNAERWSVKTGTDQDVSQVKLNQSTATTIQSLISQAAPKTIPDNRRINNIEKTVWVVNATLVKFVHAYDSDYHMVIQDSAGRTMIVEIPDPNCVGAGSPFLAGITHARQQFDARFTATEDFQTVNVPVTIKGVGFFDYKEGQEGIAPNGIELHPILDIVINGSFSLSPSTPTMTIARGGSGTTTITSTITTGFNSAVALSATGLPAGATATFAPPSIVAPGSGASNLTLALADTTPPGTYNVTVTGTGGGQTYTTNINLTVTTSQQSIGNAGFENGSTNPAPWTVTAGVIDNSGFEAPHTGSWKAWLDGYGSTHTDSILQNVSIPSTATTAALSFWLHIDTKETAATANDTLQVQVRDTSGTVLSTLASYSNLNAADGFSQVSFDFTAYKGRTVQLYLVGVENSSLKTSFVVDDFALATTTSGTPPDFTIGASPATLSVAQNGSAASTITTNISGSFNSSIALSATGLPTGATASFAPTSIAAPGNGSATMTILAGSTTAPGNYTVTVTGAGGGISHSTTIVLTVTTSGTPPDFSISASPSSLTVAQSGSGASTISTTLAGSFNSSIALSATGLPTGASASFAPTSIAAPGNGSATMTILAGSTTASGNYTVTVTGSGGGLTHSTTIALTVTASGPSPDFTIGASPATLSVAQNGSGASTITTSISGSFNSSIALSATGLPSGATPSFSPASIVAPGNGSATMTILVSSTTVPGNYTVTVTGTGGGITHSTTIALTVTAATGGTTQQLLGNPGFENGSTNAAPWTVSSGVISNDAAHEPAHGGSWVAWLDGYGTTHTDTVLQTVTIPSTATNASLTFWLHIDTKETSTTTAYDTLTVQVRNSSGTVLATLATYSNLNAAAGYKQVSFDLSSYKGQAIQVYLVGAEDSSLTTSFVVDDFALNAITP